MVTSKAQKYCLDLKMPKSTIITLKLFENPNLNLNIVVGCIRNISGDKYKGAHLFTQNPQQN